MLFGRKSAPTLGAALSLSLFACDASDPPVAEPQGDPLDAATSTEPDGSMPEVPSDAGPAPRDDAGSTPPEPDAGGQGGSDALVVRIMEANIASYSAGFPKGDVAEALKAGDPDIVIIVEPSALGGASALAAELGFERAVIAESDWFTGTEVLSRFPITENLGRGARIEPCAGVELAVYGQHFAPYPYGPYDVRDDPSLTAEELIESARSAHGDSVSNTLADMQARLDADTPVFFGGDFNEPSHRDWTEATAAAGLHFGRAVAWPSTSALEAAGMVDSYRAVHPDPVAKPGDTWTPYPGSDEVHDRIDFIFHAGAGISVRSAEVIGESSEQADIVIDGPYPSDHRFVVMEYELAGQACP